MSRPLVLVTGAGSGIGRAVALALLGSGRDVLAVGRRMAPLEALAREAPAGSAVSLLAADVSRASDLAGLAGSPPLAGIVASAGICRQARLDSPEADEIWREVIAVNLDGAWNTLLAALPLLTDGGRIVAVSSGLGKLGRAGYGAYAASKHGLLGLVKCLSLELAPRRITVNAVCPGWVDTPMADADLAALAAARGVGADRIRAHALAGIPLGRFVTPEEVAALILWLLSPAAAAVSGEALNISGGEFCA